MQPDTRCEPKMRANLKDGQETELTNVPIGFHRSTSVIGRYIEYAAIVVIMPLGKH